VAVRVDRVVSSTEATGAFGPAVARRFTNLSASAGLSLPVRRDASFAVNLAQAARVPSAEELFSRAGHAGTGAFEIGNPSLAAEVTRGVDAVLRVERRGVRLQLAAFRSFVDGWVGLYPSGRDTVVQVPGLPDKTLPLVTVAQRDARIAGGEATAEGAVARHLIVHATADVLRATEVGGGALPFMPPGRVGGGARWDDGRWQLGGALRHVFAQRRVAADELSTDAVTLVEAHAGVRLVTGARVQTVMLRVENLGDRLYRDATSRIKDFAPAPGRNVSLLYRIAF
jgi:iron complex outermembrane receptor protein